MTNPVQKVGRLALRHEVNYWNAYYTPDTMADALLLGSIAMAIVQNPERKEKFMDLMRDAVSDLIEEGTGVRPSWPEGPHVAPEHERSGHG